MQAANFRCDSATEALKLSSAAERAEGSATSPSPFRHYVLSFLLEASIRAIAYYHLYVGMYSARPVSASAAIHCK